MKKPVIYKIVNTINSKFYVGSTWDMKTRQRVHLKRLRRNDHHSAYLQNAWNKYGETAFVFEVVEQLPLDSTPEDLEHAEDRWLQEHVGKPHCYNVGRSARAPWRGTQGADAPFYGRSHAAEARGKLSEAAKRQWETSDPRTGKMHSDETREKISANVRQAINAGRGGCFIPSEETRKKMSDALKGNQCAKGYKRTDSEKERIRQRMFGNKNWLGRRHTEESKTKMRRRIVEVSSGTEFPSLTSALAHYNLKMTTLRRSLKNDSPLSKGPNKGLHFRYL